MSPLISLSCSKRVDIISYLTIIATMGLVDAIVQWVLDIIQSMGYLGIVFLMFLDGISFPIPSEVIMAFSGWLAYDGEFNLLFVILTGTLGSVIGAIVAYGIGYTGGRVLVQRFGRYVLMGDDSLDKAEAWFKHYGDWAIFLTRFVPLVRTLISFPAGIAKYDLKRFILYTALGSLIWNAVLAYLGYLLGPEWENIIDFFDRYSMVAVAALAIIAVWWVLHRLNEMGKLPSLKKGDEGV
jgi:membrane protein DedA with SNARE-associated domain